MARIMVLGCGKGIKGQECDCIACVARKRGEGTSLNVIASHCTVYLVFFTEEKVLSYIIIHHSCSLVNKSRLIKLSIVRKLRSEKVLNLETFST